MSLCTVKRVMVIECCQRHGRIRQGIDNTTFRECNTFQLRSSFKRFPHNASKVLGVAQSTECYVLEVRNRE